MNIPGAGTALCIALIGASMAQAQERTEHSAMKQTLHFAGAGPHTLELRATTGSIKVEAYDGRDVEMEVERSVSAATEDALRAADRDVILNTSENAAVVSAIVRERNEGTCGETSTMAAGIEPSPATTYASTSRSAYPPIHAYSSAPSIEAM